MITFLLKSGVCMFIFWAIYKLILENEKIHHYNRFYLIFSLFLSLIIPFIDFEVESTLIQNTIIKAPIPTNYSIEKQLIIQPQPLENQHSFTQFLIGFWVLGSVIFLIKFLKSIYQILQKIKQNQQINYQNSTLVLMNEGILPCTFLNYIFIRKDEFENIENELLQHELCHAQQLHTLDVIFIEILQMILWFNPLVYLYKKAIKLNHEFLADDAVNQRNLDIPFYQKLLLEKTVSNSLKLTSNSTFQLTKQRLMMMTKNTSAMKANIKIALTIAITALIGFGFSSKIIAQNQVVTKPKTPKSSSNRITKDDVDYKNGSYTIIRDFVPLPPNSKPRIMFPKKYEELTENEKLLITNPLYFEIERPSDKQIRDWLDSKKYGVWLNDKRISNEKLKKYSSKDFAHYFSSKLEKNAINYGKHYFQIGLMTNDYYENVYMKGIIEKPHFIIDLRTKK
jgi:bla regulator protein blaR1